MRRRCLAAGAVVAAVLGASACGGGENGTAPKSGAQGSTAGRPATYSGYRAARVLRRTEVRTRPGGRVAATLGRRTEWSSPRYLAVTRTVGDWVGVVTAARPNGHVGWIAKRDVELVEAPATINVDLSRREASVSEGGRLTLRFRIAVGQPDTPTPTGRFSVTDALHTKGSSPYGCCILALSAHQPNIAQGWTGGDRVAIHATPAVRSIGTAASNGCMRTTDAAMRRLFKAVTLGATVFVRA